MVHMPWGDLADVRPQIDPSKATAPGGPKYEKELGDGS